MPDTGKFDRHFEHDEGNSHFEHDEGNSHFEHDEGNSHFEHDERSVREKFWHTAKRAARHIPFMDEVVAAYYCALDRQTPLRTRAILYGALAYFVLPTDAIPDFILGLGFTDDIAVLTTAFAAVRAHVTPAHRLAARKALGEDSSLAS